MSEQDIWCFAQMSPTVFSCKASVFSSAKNAISTHVAMPELGAGT